MGNFRHHAGKIKERVIQNLEVGIDNDIIWSSHAAYCLRQRIAVVYPSILFRLEKSERDGYRYSDILELWFNITKDEERLTVFIKQAQSEYLKWKGIGLLEKEKKQTEFLQGYFRDMISNEAVDLTERFQAANHLIALGDITGFEFIANKFLANPTPDTEFRRLFYNISSIDDARAIPLLMKLLYYGKKPEYKKRSF